MRPIDADALKSALWETWGYNSLVAEICEFVDDQPTIQSDEPRVMTLEETHNVEVVWAEDRSTREVYPCIVKNNNMNDSKLYKYGVKWRCWTSRPTDEQRKAVKWE